MQVTAVADHVTHAVIGGQKTTEFKISGDAAMFNMLSAGMYSDQRLAVAREVLCNSWDAHIRAGREDQAIIVSISNEKIVVRDFGAGIHPDMMEPLYCTYGGTDKTNNGEETGGFGLGCKSPFSYNDHFEVISWHAGIKTIYNISKSSAERMGKPGMTAIVALPCGDETGLQVSIPLKHYNDMNMFVGLFTRIAHNGEMNVIVNGTRIKTLPLSKAENKWIITSERLSENSASHIYVRYGNVIYPVENNFAYASAYYNMIGFLENLSTRTWDSRYYIVFQAEPNSISVTPSRESLSMVDHTIESLKDLLGSFIIKDFDKKIAEHAYKLLDDQILQVASQKKIGQLMHNQAIMPGLDLITENRKDRSLISSVAEIAEQYTRKTYPKYPDFYKRDMGLRIDTAIELGVGKRGHLNQVKHQTCTDLRKLGKKRTTVSLANKQPYSWREPDSAHEWFKKRIIRPLYRDIAAAPSIKDNPIVEAKRLHIIQSIMSYEQQFTEPAKYREKVFSAYLPILRNILVLSHSKKDVGARLKYCTELKIMGGAENIWFYHAPVASTRIQATRDFFVKRGFVLIDLTVDQAWDIAKPEKKYVPVAARVVKPKVTGYAALSGFRGAHAGNASPSTANCFLDNAPRVDVPQFYVKVGYQKSGDYKPFELGEFKGLMALIVTKLFGSVCAVVRTETQEKKLKEAGLMDLNTYVMSYVTKSVTSPKFALYWAEDLNRVMGELDGKLHSLRETTLSTLFDVHEVRKVLGLKHSLDELDLMVVSLWREMASTMRHWEDSPLGDAPSIAEARKIITALPVSQNIKDITSKLTGNYFTDLIDIDVFRKIARQPNAKASGHFDKLAKIVKIALMG